MNLAKLKKLGEKIKDLPPEERKAAGLRFQALKKQLEDEVQPEAPKAKDSRGGELWSLSRGPFGHGVTMYENELHIGNVNDYTKERSTVIIKFDDTTLRMKEVKCNPKRV